MALAAWTAKGIRFLGPREPTRQDFALRQSSPARAGRFSCNFSAVVANVGQLEYLGNYTHRIAISNHLLVGLEEGKVSLRWRDSAHKNEQRVMALRVEEFLQRHFLLVLPQGFERIRHFGLFANRLRTVSLETCRRLLGEYGSSASGVPSRRWR
jgi:hypothetical protein